jgi:flagellar biosynthesis chaperone FliJ
MAELTKLESKLGEVTGLAMAAQAATRKVMTLAKKDHEKLVPRLERMRQEAAQTEERCTALQEASMARRQRFSMKLAPRRARRPR